MILLLVYHRTQGKILAQHEFADAESEQANSARLEAELEHASDQSIEIVTLQSNSLEELQRTHARYFRSLRELSIPA